MDWLKVIILLVVGCVFIVCYSFVNAKAEVAFRSEDITAKICGIEENGDSFRYFLTYCDSDKEIEIKTVHYRDMEPPYQEGDQVSISIVTYKGGATVAEICDDDLLPVSDYDAKGSVVLLIIGITALILSLGMAIRALI